MIVTNNGPGAITLAPEDRIAAVAEVKATLRVTSAYDEPLIAAFVETALSVAEAFVGRVLIRRAGGDGDGWAGMPAPIRQGTVLLATHLYDLRDSATPPPAAVTALWRPYRVMHLGAEAQQEVHPC